MALPPKASVDTQILTDFDEQMRRERLPSAGQRAEKTARVTRIYGDIPGAEFGAILHSTLHAHDADSAIEAEVAHFRSLGLAFEWKVFSHDRPSDLGDRLVRHGFRQGDREALVCREVRGFPSVETPTGIRIERLADASGLSALAQLEQAAGHRENVALRMELREELTRTPNRLSVFVAWDGALPVAKAWIRYYADRDFADLWGGETLASHRKRGIYRALVAARLAEAQTRGVRYATTDALPSSQPILEKTGFRRLTWTTPYLWVPLS